MRETGQTLLGQVLRLAHSREECADEELVQRFVEQRDEDAFEVLVRRHGPMVLRLGKRLLGNLDDAEDVFQATFLVLARQACRLRKQASVASWLYGVASRLAYRAFRARQRRQAVEDNAPVSAASDPVREITLREAQAAFDDELSRLPEKLRGPIVLCYLEGMTRDEAAGRLGLPLSTLKSQLDKARRLLHQRLGGKGLTLSGVLLSVGLPQVQANVHLPSTLVSVTVETARHVSSGGPVSGVVSAKVVALAGNTVGSTGVLVKWALTLVLGTGIVAGLMFPPNAQPVRPALPPIPSRPSPGEKASLTDAHGDPLPHGALLRLGTVRNRHDNWIMAGALSPDGTILAGGGQDRVRLWDTSTGKVIRDLQLGSGMLGKVAFSPDGKSVAVSGRDFDIRLVDVDTGKVQQTFTGHRPPRDNQNAFAHTLKIYSMHFTPDGKTLISLGADQTIRWWDVAGGRELRQIDAGGSGPLVLSADGKHLAGGVNDEEEKKAEIHLWNTSTGERVRRWPVADPSVRVQCFSPDGRTLVAAGSAPENNNVLSWWDVATGKQSRASERIPCIVSAAAYSPDGKLFAFATVYPNFKTYVRSTAGEKSERVLATKAYGLGFLEEGKVLATWGASNAFHFWETATGKPIRRFAGAEASLGDVTYSPDGKLIAAACGSEGAVRLWDSATGKQVALFREGESNVVAVVFTLDGKQLIAGNADGIVRVWDVATGKVVRRLEGHKGWVQKLALSPDGRTLAVSDEGNAIHLWDLPTGVKGKLWAAHPAISRLAFSPDGKVLALGSAAGNPEKGEWTIRRWDVTTAMELPRLEQQDQSGVTCIAFSPDGRLLASSDLNHRIHIYDVLTGRRRVTFDPRGRVTFVAFSPDGRSLACANNGQYRRGGEEADPDNGNANRNHLILWNVYSGDEIARLGDHAGGVASIAFSPDGRRMVTASHDTTGLVWDMTTLPARPQADPLDDRALSMIWDNLGSGDPARVHEAIGKLLARPRQAVDLLKPRLAGIAAADRDRFAKLLPQLDSEDFEAREGATRELKRMGVGIEPLLREAIAKNLSQEARRRVREVLEGIEVECRGHLRAIEALERLGTKEAREILEPLSKGHPEHSLTREAKAALRRLQLSSTASSQ